MNESEMDYRGSKSNKSSILFVKEQRVDDSYMDAAPKINIQKNIKYPMLRCTLMDSRKKLSVQSPC